MPTAATPVTCKGITKAGKSCKRRAAKGSDYCSQHAPAAAASPRTTKRTDAPRTTKRSDAKPRTTKRTDTPPRTTERTDASSADNGAGDAKDDGGARSWISDNIAGGYGSIDGEAYGQVLEELAQSVDSVRRESSSIVDDLLSSLGEAQRIAEKVGGFAVEHGLVAPKQIDELTNDLMAAATSAASAFAARASGNFEEDDFGFDEQFTVNLSPIFGLLYKYYWRVDIQGIENVPAEGAGLLVSNHAGSGIPFDGAMTKYAIFHEQKIKRHARMLVLDWAMGFPYMGEFMRRTGQVLAGRENATELLRRGHLVGVFPEGIRGMAKPYSDRYQLQRFGRGGFVRIALETGAPIIPVAVVGSEEIYPKIANVPFVNKLIGAPFVPLTPTFPLFGLAGAIPLPSKWIIEFCEPIHVADYNDAVINDRTFVLELSDRVRTTIQDTLNRNLEQRQTPFW